MFLHGCLCFYRMKIVSAAVLFLTATAWGGESPAFASREAVMKSFAELLKIPLASPSVSVTIRQVTEEEGLYIEDISWESLDGEEPIAYFIRPVTSAVSFPAIVCLHGTGGSRDSMTTPFFGVGDWKRPGDKTSHTRMLGWARELARRGFAVLALTQRGLDIRTPDTNGQAKDLLVRGRTLMGAIVYEIRQGISFLCQRKDIDPNRIGITGMSFGGITAFYTWLVDSRVAASAPLCGGVGSIDVFLRAGSRSYHGLYWWIPGMLAQGDQGDFAAAMAPRPLMLWAPLHDIGMPKEGVDRFLEVVQPAYRDVKAEGNLVVHRPPGEHEFTVEAFEAMVNFMEKKLPGNPK